MTTLTSPGADEAAVAELELTAARHYPHRWRLHRVGIVNVWFYYDNEFPLPGGRGVLRGTNGAGKSRALEMLLPFVLDADRRKMDASGSGKVRLQDLMKTGGEDQPNRGGYLWVELTRDPDPDETGDPADRPPGKQYLTVGAFVRFSKSTGEARVWYFTTPLRVAHELVLLGPDRVPLPREKLTEQIGNDRVTDTPEAHRDRVRAEVFGLTGEFGRERYAGLLQLLHTLRSPDVGNRIEEGRLPQILSDALPPLSESALDAAGEKLDGLSETRDAQQRLEDAHRQVATFLDVYRRYTAGVLADTAQAANEAAGAARRTESDANRRRREHDHLINEHTKAEAARDELVGHERELAATITGIKESKAYADARDLDEREHRVTAFGRTADISLGRAATARRAEQAAVTRADDAAADAVQGVGVASRALAEAGTALQQARMSTTVTAGLGAETREAGAVAGVVRTDRYGEPAPVTRPVPAQLEVVPDDLAEVAADLRRAGEAATQRAAHARTRREQAARVAEMERTVRDLDRRAEEADQRRETAQGEADAAVEFRDETAVTLGLGWREWVQDPATTRLLGPVEWEQTGLGALLADPGALTGDGEDPGELAELGHAAADAADAGRRRLSRRLADLDSAQTLADETRRSLDDEGSQLRAAVDVPPPGPDWLTSAPPGSQPLWRVVEFADHLDPAECAGLEAALLGSGLLHGAVGADGSLRAANGQLLVQPRGPVAGTPLSAALVADPAASVSGDAVHAVLDRVWLGEAAGHTWVAADGSWGNGQLDGRLAGTQARFIGAAARQAAREARLAALDAELTALDEADAAREQHRAMSVAEQAELAAHLRAVPAAEPLTNARTLAVAAARLTAKAVEELRVAAGRAAQDRRAWTLALSEHRQACTHFDLPDDADELSDVVTDSKAAATACRTAAGQVDAVAQTMARHAAVVAAVDGERIDREQAEQDAQKDWGTWHRQDAELAAVRANVGASAEQIRTELTEAESALELATAQLEATRNRVSELGNAAAEAKVEARTAQEKASDAGQLLREAAENLLARALLPGVADGAAGGPVTLTLTEFAPARVEEAAAAVTAAVDRRGGAADESALFRALQTFDASVSALDVAISVERGVRLVEVADASGRRTVAAAAAELTRQRDQGRAALSAKEHAVFTEFVLGGVAEELRRRLRQAEELVLAMNSSLAGIRTSHGIGVKLRWHLAESAGPSAARIRELVATAGEARSADASAELTQLLKARVDEAHAVDPTAGYATHLKAALNYRDWHDVEVNILGPSPGQERRLSRRAKLSQGETRFVSYVTLFAAVDAYLSGLPDTGRALRLMLLDDAFAKVDDRTIGELMGLLVRLDIDFLMTGHALWGCYPQVPSLDCYEVRRREGTAAVTTRVHWDGKARHLRVAG